MILPDMITKAIDPRECLFTQLTREILLTNFIFLQMSPAVFLEIFLLGEYFTAHFTLVLFAGRGFLMSPVALG